MSAMALGMDDGDHVDLDEDDDDDDLDQTLFDFADHLLNHFFLPRTYESARALLNPVS